MPPVKNRIVELIRDTLAPLLVEKALELCGKMTTQEQSEMDSGTFRLPKNLLCALDLNKIVSREIGSEATGAEVRRLRRIGKRASTVCVGQHVERTEMKVNNLEWGIYQGGEVFIQTTPKQSEANQGKVFLTVVELHRLLALVAPHDLLLAAAKRAVEFLSENPSGPAMPVAIALNEAIAQATRD